jgi:hypothetical protein
MEVLADAAGRRPSGWFSLPRQGDAFAGGSVSPHTMDLLIEEGFAYFGNGLADDIPHWWVTDFAARRAMLALPYYYHFDDQFFCMFPAKGTGLDNPDALARNWRWEFEAQYRRGRHFHMTLHTQHIGWCHLPGGLESDRRGLRVPLARGLPRRDAPAAGAEHLAGPPGKPGLITRPLPGAPPVPGARRRRVPCRNGRRAGHTMPRPPLTTRLCPVTKRPSSLTR